LEIYNEDIRDLLSKNPNTKLEMKENADKGVYIKDLMQFVVKSREEITSVLEVGAVQFITVMSNQGPTFSVFVYVCMRVCVARVT
jgi:kinesin family protein 3/17